jgi:ubiquinone/menaquinone biosynthesis C-methylase UbiE
MQSVPLWRPVRRVPEAEGLYDRPEEVDAYQEESRKGIVALIERQFVARVLAELGHRERLRVLDVGTGPGWVAAALAEAKPSWSVAALDASTLMLDMAARNAAARGASIECIHAKADRIPLPTESCDLVVSHFAFSEFHDGKAALSEIARVLKLGGSLLLQDLERPSTMKLGVLSALKQAMAPFKRMNQQYVESLRGAYTRDELAALVDESGMIASVRVGNRWVGGHVQVMATKPVVQP